MNNLSNNILNAIDKGIQKVLVIDDGDSSINYNTSKIDNTVNLKKITKQEKQEFLDLIKKYNFKNVLDFVKIHPDVKYTVPTKKELLSIIRMCIEIDPCCNLNWLDVKRITNMSNVFAHYSDFNGDITEWDMSRVTNMNQMFFGCKSFNQPIGNWDVSNVTTMFMTFTDCKTFNQPLGQWGNKMGNVTDANGMFANCRQLNQDFKNWDMHSNTDFNSMFSDCRSFNGDVSGWTINTGLFPNMVETFLNCVKFEGRGLSSWNNGYFTYTYNENRCHTGILYNMFGSCNKLKENLNNWKISNALIDNVFPPQDKFNYSLYPQLI